MIEHTIPILESAEPFIEFVNLVVALIIVLLGFYTLRVLGGELRKVWVYFLTAIALFGIHEVFGFLNEAGIFGIGGLYAFTEFLFIISFFVSTIIFQKLLKAVSKGKGAKA